MRVDRSSSTVTVYEPDGRRRTGFLASTWIMLSNIHRSRELILRVFARDFLAGYRKSFLGVAWILIAPLLGALVWIFMNAAGILHPGNVGIPYPAYLLLGTSIWALFKGFYDSASGTLSAGQSFIFQVHYPHEALLVTQILQQIANFAVGLVVNLIILLIFGVVPSWKVVFLPIVILPLLFVGAGLGLVASVIDVVATEGKRLIDYGMTLALYLTPVIYSSRVDNRLLRHAIRWNPLTYLIGGTRDLIVYGRIEPLKPFLVVYAASLLAFLAALRFFFLSEQRVIEKIL